MDTSRRKDIAWGVTYPQHILVTALNELPLVHNLLLLLKNTKQKGFKYPRAEKEREIAEA